MERDAVFQVRASHILLDSESEVEKVLEEISKGTRFEDVAKEYSICPSGNVGGDMGYFTRNVMIKPIERAAFSLRKGEVSGPIKTELGYHILKVTEKIS